MLEGVLEGPSGTKFWPGPEPSALTGMLLSTLGSATMKRLILASQWMPPIVFGGRFALKSHPKGPLPTNVPVLVSSTFIVAR